MTTYMSAVFRVIAESSPEVFRSNGVSPLELAQVTARQCFLENGIDLNGTLSFQQFRAWYTSPGSLLGRCGCVLPIIQNCFQDFNALIQHCVHATCRGDTEHASNAVMNLDELREASGLGSFSPGDVFDMLQGTESMDKEEFNTFFEKVVQQGGGDMEKLGTILTQLFQIFDRDGDGTIDARELAAGAYNFYARR